MLAVLNSYSENFLRLQTLAYYSFPLNSVPLRYFSCEQSLAAAAFVVQKSLHIMLNVLCMLCCKVQFLSYTPMTVWHLINHNNILRERGLKFHCSESKEFPFTMKQKLFFLQNLNVVDAPFLWLQPRQKKYIIQKSVLSIAIAEGCCSQSYISLVPRTSGVHV